LHPYGSQNGRSTNIKLGAQWIVESNHICGFHRRGSQHRFRASPVFADRTTVSGRDETRDCRHRPGVSSQIRPDPSHLALVELQQISKLPFLVPPICRESGIRPEILAELHVAGKLSRMRPAICGQKSVGTNRFGPGCERKNRLPVAALSNCGGHHSSVVNFEDPMRRKIKHGSWRTRNLRFDACFKFVVDDSSAASGGLAVKRALACF